MNWTRERLEEAVRGQLGPTKLIVVANREPYIHWHRGGDVVCMRPASGLTTALDPVMRACGGVWVGHGSGDADAVTADPFGRVRVPPDRPAYTLRRVWLSKPEELGYYYGFANDSLWPLCHNAYARPSFRPEDWEQYVRVNRKFADAVLDEAGDGPALVFVQDYHFALLPRMLKQARPDLTVAHFWHIPWPNPEVFRVCPWQAEILDGLLGNDLMSFHIQHHCNNFLATVDRVLECTIDAERFAVRRHGRTTLVHPHPIGIDPDAVGAELAGADMRAEERRFRRRHDLGNRMLLVGVDRVDYTKGIPERFAAVDRLLTTHPTWRGKFTFVQAGTPSRTHLTSYRVLNEELRVTADEINRRHGDPSWRPIVFLNEHLPPHELAVLYRVAAGCVVSSLHDGMNLVAKEFVATRTDERGVLVLSRFTGAARELTDAVLVNPFSRDELAEGMRQALLMRPEEQAARMRRMRAQVCESNVYRWAGKLLAEAARLADGNLPSAAVNGYEAPRPVLAGEYV
jgi:trehalose 6-phosphate synthase